MAEENGGYPAGYLFVAASAEVTDRAPGNGPEAAPRSTVAMLVNNAMNAPIMERTSYGTESVWEVQDGTGTKAVSYTHLDVYKRQGVYIAGNSDSEIRRRCWPCKDIRVDCKR